MLLPFLHTVHLPLSRPMLFVMLLVWWFTSVNVIFGIKFLRVFNFSIDDDDDVIFVGEQRGTIDLCSPEPSSRFNLRFNGNQQQNRALPPTEKSCTATAPTTPDNSDAGPAKNSVFCAVCKLRKFHALICSWFSIFPQAWTHPLVGTLTQRNAVTFSVGRA